MLKDKDYGQYALTVGSLEVAGELTGAAVSKIITDSTAAQHTASLLYSTYDAFITSIISDGKLSVAEKADLARRWDEIETEYPLVKTNAENVGVNTSNATYEAYETAYTNLNTYLNGASGVLVDMSVASDIDAAAFTTLYTAYTTALYNLIGLTYNTTITTAAATAPKYIGAYLYTALPATANAADTALAYSLTEAECGIYFYASGWSKLTPPTSLQISQAWPDVCRAVLAESAGGFPGGPYPASPNNTVDKYIGGGVNYSEVLGANLAFINSLFANNITLPSGGIIQSGTPTTGSGFRIGASGIEIGSGDFYGTLKTPVLQTQNGQGGDTISAPSPTYWPGSAFVTHCEGSLDTGWIAVDGSSSFDTKNISHIIKPAGTLSSVSYQSSDASASAASTTWTTVKTMTCKVTGEAYLSCLLNGQSLYGNSHARILLNGSQVAYAINTGGILRLSNTLVAGYVTLSDGDTIIVQVYTEKTYRGVGLAYITNFRVSPSEDTVGVYYNVTDKILVIENDKYYDEAGTVDVSGSEFATATYDTYWNGLEFINLFDAKVSPFVTQEVASGTFNSKTAETVYIAGNNYMTIAYVSGDPDTINATGYYNYTGSVVLLDSDGAVIISSEDGTKKYDLQMGTNSLRVENKTGDSAASIISLRSSELYDSGDAQWEHEATLSLHCVEVSDPSAEDWLYDISLHDYTGAYRAIHYIKNFTGSTPGDFKWGTAVNSGGMVETLLMRLYGATGNLWIKGQIDADGGGNFDGAVHADGAIDTDSTLYAAGAITTGVAVNSYKIDDDGTPLATKSTTTNTTFTVYKPISCVLLGTADTTAVLSLRYNSSAYAQYASTNNTAVAVMLNPGNYKLAGSGSDTVYLYCVGAYGTTDGSSIWS